MLATRKTSRALLALLTLPLLFSSAAAEDAAAKPEQTSPETLPVAQSGTPSATQSGTKDRDASELSRIESELAAVMDELVSARSRASVLARSLFHTELNVEVIRRADAQQLAHVSLRLDGVPVHDSDGSALASDRAAMFSGYVTPGMHELSIELVENGKDDAAYGYTRSERYRIDVKKDRRTTVELVLRDDSDMAEEAAEGDEGEYDVHTTVRVTSERARD